MSLPYQIVFSADEAYKMAKQANERIKETVSFYVNHFYKLILAKILVGEFTAHINFKRLDEEKVDKILKEGTIVRISRDAKNHKKCLGPFTDFRNGIITSVLECEGGTRYLIKVIGEKACALSDMPTNAYDIEKTYLRALIPTSIKIGLKGRSFPPIIDEEKLHVISSTLYSADELEVGSFEERYQIITETMEELDSLLDITIIGRAGACIGYPTKYTDYLYKITWKSEEEQKKDLEQEQDDKPYSSLYPSEEEYAELYNLKQCSSTSEKAEAKNEEKPKAVEEVKEVCSEKYSSALEKFKRSMTIRKSYGSFYTPPCLSDLDFDNLKVLPELNDGALNIGSPIDIILTPAT